MAPPAYPTDVLYTPGVFQKRRSAPQKHPIPNTATSDPSGKGETMRLPLTKWRSGTSTGVLRPGSASDRSGRVDALRENQLMAQGYWGPGFEYPGTGTRRPPVGRCPARPVAL